MLKQRIITGIIVVLVLFAALFVLPPIGFFFAILTIGVLCSIEWAKMSKAFGTMGLLIFPIGITAVSALLWYYGEYAILYNLAGVIVWLVLATTLAGGNERIATPGLALVTAVVVIPFAVFSISELMASHSDGRLWLVGMFLLVGISDSAAYFACRRFVRTKLAPRISPGKTREGLIGALLVVWLVALAAGVMIWPEDYSTMLIFAAICLICALFSVVGDLFVSLQKRKYGVKDSGTLLPGHGGFLDRFDSTLAVAPAYALCVKLLPLG